MLLLVMVMIKRIQRLIVLLAVFGLHSNSTLAQSNRNMIVHVSDIGTSITVIGKIGLPMGTVAKINAVIINGAETGCKGDCGSYLLKVLSVGGNTLTNSVLMSFMDSTGKIPNEAFGRAKQVFGKKVESLTDADIDKINRNFVGRSLWLLAYENGEFSGQPNALPADFPIPQDIGFSFQTQLTIVKVLQESKK